jgi:hypothetical protein
MSFQAYLDNIEEKTGLTPRQLVELGTAKGFGRDTKAAPIVDWLAADYGLGRGHAMAIVHVITRGDTITVKGVDENGARVDVTEKLWLDGKASKPAPDA